MTELTIDEGTQVTLHFALKLESGEIVDSNFDADPATFVMGDGNLLPGFEKALVGMAAGDKNSFVIAPEDGFGQSNPNNLQTMDRDQFDDEIELVEGLMLSFADAQNAEMPGVVSCFDDDSVTIDFNHPLAGRNIVFEVEILQVAPVVTH
ncbi:FKBP-type peptidyl-prolyl cis-trans isomerase [Pseudomaricurvus alkylphenolicus]|jgi:FKBP-type peptidyl-prolyl cis-trans isomerase SlpA|uniref:FKBP-type peptidyl-prolyl cis-trans isomerase n=1 Tax=Pseudomaricurvus alkylphenolicus TaxID=1306991 RepID=UPI00141E678F|nr:FKBP-type peptidyl-prolyl cis-trans isomerase [Pseudomaricurvus alkylphenolicus]NIB40255.1 FKBP-type peptidyl-prolyl cis-trans isomerase [Pseudomaricurvus alkylphenolicus]